MIDNFDQILTELKFCRKRSILAKTAAWEATARPEQRMPEGDWFGWFIMAGRGFGKTRTGAETVKQLVLSGKYKRICLLGETYDQVRSIMVNGESGLMAVHSKDDRPKFKSSRRELIWPNGAIATCHSAENCEALRGPQFDLAWIDELAKFDDAEEVWNQLMFCLRLGTAPKVIITTTPRPRKIIMELMNRENIHLTRGSTFDNASHLPPRFLEMIQSEYGNTNLGRQEIEGELLSFDTAALWNHASFKYEKLTAAALKKHRVVIAIDPATTSGCNSNETGLVVASRCGDKYFILEDFSEIMQPEVWAQKAYELYKKYNAEEIIVENNQGGEILMAMLHSFAKAPWKNVRAKESKYKRAQPIASLYQQDKVRHAKKFEILEEQLLKAHVKFADDRMDAMVWALFSLMQKTEEIQENGPLLAWG